ncbi:MAG: hypothetical protein WKG07_06790 [Hymenobacter sp.]
MFSTLSSVPALAATSAHPHYVWPHQHRYREAAQHIAQALFDALDDDLEPYVQLLALPADPAAGLRHLPGAGQSCR